MLMTVLRGPLAIQQSKTLIRLFEKLKNYYVEAKGISAYNEIIKLTNSRIHGRYIVIDYKENNEMIFDCGASSKDAGNKVTTIMEIEYKEGYHPRIDNLLDDNTIL